LMSMYHWPYSEKCIRMPVKRNDICSCTDQTVCCQNYNTRFIYITTNSGRGGKTPCISVKQTLHHTKVKWWAVPQTVYKKWTEPNHYSNCCCCFSCYNQPKSIQFTLVPVNSFNINILSVAQTIASTSRINSEYVRMCYKITTG
jgi:hypothetical protein